MSASLPPLIDFDVLFWCFMVYMLIIIAFEEF